MKSSKEILLSLLEEGTEKIVERDMNLVDDLGMDSIKLLDFVIKLEEKFDIEFNEFSELSQHMKTVGEMIDFFDCFLNQEVNDNEQNDR